MVFGVDPSAFASQQLSMSTTCWRLSRNDVRELFQHLTGVLGRIVPYDEAQLILLGEDGSPISVRQDARERSERVAGRDAGDSRR